jgi:hypothetical protein
MLTAHVNEIGIVLRGFHPQQTPEWWESLLDELKAHHIPGLNPTGKRMTLDAGGPGGSIRGIINFSPNTVTMDESIPILEKHGIQVYDVRED